MEPSEVLSLLAGTLALVSGNSRPRKRVEALLHQPLRETLSSLSLLEREVGDALSIRLIAMAKQTLSGKREYEEFRIACHRAAGTI
jgi:hypothetical protein